jgi:hypothetical protein
MKKTILCLVTLFLLAGARLQAQDTSSHTIRIKEIGLSSTSLTSSYGVTYSWGSSSFLWSLRTASISAAIPSNKPDSSNVATSPITSITNTTSTNTSFGLNINFGFEKYIQISPKIAPFWGLNLIASYQYSATHSWTTKTIANTIAPGLGLRLGLRYTLTPKIALRADLNPNVSYSIKNSVSYNNIRPGSGSAYQISTPTDVISVNLANSTVAFTITYNFAK